MIRKQFPDNHWCGCCPNCCSFYHEFVSAHSEAVSTVYEYECNYCGAHWEVEHKHITENQALMDAKLAGK